MPAQDPIAPVFPFPVSDAQSPPSQTPEDLGVAVLGIGRGLAAKGYLVHIGAPMTILAGASVVEGYRVDTFFPSGQPFATAIVTAANLTQISQQTEMIPAAEVAHLFSPQSPGNQLVVPR